MAFYLEDQRQEGRVVPENAMKQVGGGTGPHVKGAGESLQKASKGQSDLAGQGRVDPVLFP